MTAFPPVRREQASGGPAVWRGSGASAGRARGRSAVVRTEEDLARVGDGDVLVVRHATAAMLPALARAAGAVCERGGVLNHLAVLTRELGKPCVTGVAGIVDALEPGAWLRIDGTRGIVEVDGPGRERTGPPPPPEDSAQVAVMQFGRFGAAFERVTASLDVEGAVSIAALASVPGALGIGPAWEVEIRDGRVYVDRTVLAETAAALAERVADGRIAAGELRSRFERLVAWDGWEALGRGDGLPGLLAEGVRRYGELSQIVWAASLAREPLAKRYRAFLRERLQGIDDDECERIYLGSLTPGGTSYIMRSALDGSRTIWGPGEAPPAGLHACVAADEARERLGALLSPGDVGAAGRYQTALTALVDMTERKNTDLHRCARELFGDGARRALVGAEAGLAPTGSGGQALAAAIGGLARRLAQNRISTIPGGPDSG